MSVGVVVFIVRGLLCCFLYSVVVVEFVYVLYDYWGFCVEWFEYVDWVVVGVV